MLLSELGQRIRSRRERLGLKQLDIANALQISPQAVSKWERGENSPDIAILGALSKLLGVSTDWLLDTYRDGLDEFDATVFTSTVLGAYAKSLRMKAGEFAVWANGFLMQLTEVVLRYDGIPIKYMGDAFLCFFSGSTSQSCRSEMQPARAGLHEATSGEGEPLTPQGEGRPRRETPGRRRMAGFW
jgi:transcriptional regulator with XRE-family HTH domain